MRREAKEDRANSLLPKRCSEIAPRRLMCSTYPRISSRVSAIGRSRLAPTQTPCDLQRPATKLTTRRISADERRRESERAGEPNDADILMAKHGL